MFYFFARDSEFVRFELRPVLGSQQCQIVVSEPGLPERIETYPTWEAASDRWGTLKAHFQDDGWQGPLGRE